jgi:hypothetical protein
MPLERLNNCAVLALQTVAVQLRLHLPQWVTVCVRWGTGELVVLHHAQPVALGQTRLGLAPTPSMAACVRLTKSKTSSEQMVHVSAPLALALAATVPAPLAPLATTLARSRKRGLPTAMPVPLASLHPLKAVCHVHHAMLATKQAMRQAE